MSKHFGNWEGTTPFNGKKLLAKPFPWKDSHLPLPAEVEEGKQDKREAQREDGQGFQRVEWLSSENYEGMVGEDHKANFRKRKTLIA